MFIYELGAAVMLVTSQAAFEAHERNKQPVQGDDGLQGARLLEYAGPIEAGHVIARGERLDGPNVYEVRYRGGDGRQIDAWWEEKAIMSDPRETEFAEV